MKNLSNNKNWNRGAVQIHAEPPLVLLIKSNNDEKLDKDFVKIKFRRDITAENSNPCEFKMSLFYNVDT